MYPQDKCLICNYLQNRKAAQVLTMQCYRVMIMVIKYKLLIFTYIYIHIYIPFYKHRCISYLLTHSCMLEAATVKALLHTTSLTSQQLTADPSNSGNSLTQNFPLAVL